MDTLFSFKYMRLIAATLGVSLILFLFASIGLLSSIIDRGENDNVSTIDVEGYAEKMLTPDIASFSFSVTTESKDMSTAQNESAKKVNSIISFFKQEGKVAENDIKTSNYNLYPRYEYRRLDCKDEIYCDNTRVLMGYVVTQTITVKVRDIDKAGELLAAAGERGATNISGLSFTTDDNEKVKEELILQATADARRKAQNLAKELGVKLGKIVSFHTNGDNIIPFRRENVAVMGLQKSADIAVSPEVPVGENKITAQVTISYKID